MRSLRMTRGEGGQVLPVLLVLVVALVIGGVMLFQVGRAADLRAEAQTAADAAALAAAENIADQLQSLYLSRADTDAVLPIDELSAQSAAEDYAGRNGARLVDYERVGLDVLVEVESLEGLDEDARRVGAEGQRSGAKARAHLDIVYLLGLPPGHTEGFGLGNNAIPPSELKELAAAAGLDKVPLGSALRRYAGTCDSGGVDVANLTEEMQIAILQAEAEVGPLYLNSAFRTVECQAGLFATVTGPVAPPGRSMHNYGMAVDVQNWQALASVAGSVGLCQPLPTNDAVHFSLAAGPECGGQAGVLGGGPFGGGLGSFARFEAILVPLDGS